MPYLQGKLKKRDVRYAEYLGDGDNNAVKSVLASKLYGEEVEISKMSVLGIYRRKWVLASVDFAATPKYYF